MNTGLGACVGAGRAVPPTCLIPAPRSSVALWGLAKKKPLELVRQSHGTQGDHDLEQPYWVSAVAALRNSDLVATGAWCWEPRACFRRDAGLRGSLHPSWCQDACISSLFQVHTVAV